MTNKAIYQPKGKAAEYSEWACNFYIGCSNACTYCYLKKGRGASILGKNKATLKKCFKDEKHALEIFDKELQQNLIELQKNGLFFSFTSDPLLLETINLTLIASGIALHNYQVPIKILTKCTYWVDNFLEFMNNSNSDNASKDWRKNLSFGFSLTGHDELEPNASTNAERIEAMKKLHDAGFRTFASLEPVINFVDTLEIIEKTQGICDLYKIGLESGKTYSKKLLAEFIEKCCLKSARMSKIYFKDSLLSQANVKREDLPSYCVQRNYELHKN